VKPAGSVAIVTGASGGIGTFTARAFAKAGANLVLAGLPNEVQILDQLAEEAVAQGVRAIVVPTDVTSRDDVDRLVASAVERFGTVDVLANVHGVGSRPSLCDQTDEEIEQVLAINLLGCARTMHAVLPIMKQKRRGAIVSVGSVAGEAGVLGVYSASKFGLRGLSDSVRREVRSYGIGVTLIEPGFVRTPMNAAMGNLPSPDIVAQAIVRAVSRPKRRVIVPFAYRFAVFAAQMFPGFIDLVFGDPRIQVRLNRDSRAKDGEAKKPA
jgi:NAD(P)-dependent dehydrogenase (short-subunit alcohol dehydrogenase family)